MTVFGTAAIFPLSGAFFRRSSKERANDTGLFVETKAEYITRLQAAIETLHKCRATHRRTVKVDESVPERWQGQVEIFWLAGHPSAKRCFAWVEPAGDGGEPRVIAVLEIPPVIGPATAVRAALSMKSSS